MNWLEAEAALRLHIETQWAIGSYASVPLVWENEEETVSESYMMIEIEGVFSEKTIYGSTGKRSSVEAGIVFFHCFVPKNSGKSAAVGPVVTLNSILELQTVSQFIDLEGGNPPSPAQSGSDVPEPQPEGNYYRCSGSVPFIVRSVV